MRLSVISSTIALRSLRRTFRPCGKKLRRKPVNFSNFYFKSRLKINLKVHKVLTQSKEATTRALVRLQRILCNPCARTLCPCGKKLKVEFDDQRFCGRSKRPNVHNSRRDLLERAGFTIARLAGMC